MQATTESRMGNCLAHHCSLQLNKLVTRQFPICVGQEICPTYMEQRAGAYVVRACALPQETMDIKNRWVAWAKPNLLMYRALDKCNPTGATVLFSKETWPCIGDDKKHSLPNFVRETMAPLSPAHLSMAHSISPDNFRFVPGKKFARPTCDDAQVLVW